MSTYDVVAEIHAERRRQIEQEGWTPEHDDEHDNRELALAAGCYAYAAGLSETDREFHSGSTAMPLPLWPWDFRYWKPKDRRRDLIRAAALIVAEIERLDRAGQ